MADIAQMLYNYNPQGVYEENRLRSLQADAEALRATAERAKLNRQQKIWGLQDLAANGDENARAQLAYYDPEGSAKTNQISRAAWQDAGRFARAYNNAPDDMKAAIAQQMVGYMGKTYGNSIISDIPPISDTANFGNFMSGLAQAVDNMDISGRDLWQAEEEAKARAEQQAFDMQKLYANDALTRSRDAIKSSNSYKKMQELVQMGVPPQTAMVMAYNGNSEAVGQGLIDGSLFNKKGTDKLSQEMAKNYAEDLNEYNNMLSKMPELNETVDRLMQLAKTATYTKTGQFRDAVAQERGKPTQASVDRDEYESIIANQILPLLRDTFGAQFTEREGNSLKATLGDPNKSPLSKVRVLNSFIVQKRKSLESKYRKLQSYSEGVSQPTQQSFPDGTVIQNAKGVKMIMRNGQWKTM